MTGLRTNFKVVKAILANPQMIRVRPSVNLFMAGYMRKFRISDIGGQLFIHSHLPAINSRAFSRVVNEHLLKKSAGPSHAQIANTNVCPQK